MIAISNTEQNLYTAIRAWLLSILPTPWEVVQGQNNYVPLPVNPCVVMTSAGADRLMTNTDNLDSTGLINSVSTQIQYKIQLDFYGAGSAEYSMIVSTMMRDCDTPAQFPAYIQPLYADNVMQIPLVTGGENYLERWKLTAYFDFNPVMQLATQSANAVNVGIIPVDIFYK